MSRPLRSLPLLLTFFILAAPAFQPAAALGVHRAARQHPKQVIENLEEQWRTATLNADPALMDSLLSDDYVGISWTGQVNTKIAQLDRLRNHTLVLSRLDLSDLRVKIVGSIAIVTSRAEIDGTNDGNEMHGTFRYTRVYQRLPSGTWKITNFEATRVPAPGERRLHETHP